MIKIEFEKGLFKIQEVFGAQYSKPMSEAIYSLTMKWRESTWNKVIEFLTYSFKPGFNLPLPVPSDYKKTYGEIPLDDEYIPISRQNNGEYATSAEISSIFEPLIKKMSGGKAFRLKTSHISGRFACEICYRSGCKGAAIARMKSGCAAYLSEDQATEKAEIYKAEREYIKEKTGYEF